MGRSRPTELFPTDGPLPADALIGRGQDIADIAAKMQVGSNSVLSAPRRTGKTTVCDAAVAAVADNGDTYTVCLDLFAIDGIAQLAEALVTETMRNRAALRKVLAAAKQTGRSLYDGLSLTITPKMLGTPELEGVDVSVLPRLANDPLAQLDYALALAQRVAAADNKRLVLYIDEFQDVQRIGDNHKNGWSVELKRKMRAAFQRSPDVSFLFAGSLEHMMRHMFGSSDEPFFQFGTFHALHPITPDEWRQGLTAKLESDRTSIDAMALDLIVERGVGHPRSTMLVAQHAHLNAILAETRCITLELAALAYESCLAAEQPKHEAMLDRVRNIGKPATSRSARNAIEAVAAGRKPYSGARTPTEIARGLNALQDAGLVEHHEQSWSVTDPLFGEYLRRARCA